MLEQNPRAGWLAGWLAGGADNTMLPVRALAAFADSWGNSDQLFPLGVLPLTRRSCVSCLVGGTVRKR